MKSSKTHQSSLTLKGGSTSYLGLLPSGKKRKPPYSVLKPLRYKVGGPSEVYASSELRFFVRGWDRMDTLFRMFVACSMLKGCLLDACCLLELLFDGTADKMDGALRNLLILSSYSP